MTAMSVYVTSLIPEAGLVALQQAALKVRTNPRARPLRREELLAEIQSQDAILCGLQDRVDRGVLTAAAPRCKVVAVCAVGYDNVDLAAAGELGIVVTNTPDVLTEATADLTWALLLASGRRLGEAERFLRSGAWQGWGVLDFLGAEVQGRTLGIVGAGRIGTAVARPSRGFEMRVLYCSRSANPKIEALGATRASLHDLLEASDFVSLHVPLTEATHRLIDAAAFRRIKPGAILVNTARGAVVDQVAMIDALREGRLGAVGLDVYDGEPAVPEELLDMENVVLLPHIGSATVSTRNRMAEIAAANVIAVLRGEPAPNPVTP